MRRLLLLILVLLVCLPAVEARRKKPKAGKVEDGVFKDAANDFSIKIREGWKYKIRAKEDHFRFVLTQSKWEAPPYYQDAKDYTKVPRVVVWADTTTLGIFPFIDSLVSESYRSDQKKEIFREFEIFNSDPSWEPLRQKGRKTKVIGGERGIHWAGQVAYTKNVSLSSSSDSGKRIKGSYGSTIAGVKKDNKIVLIYMICEWGYYDQIDALVMDMVATLEWTDTESKE